MKRPVEPDRRERREVRPPVAAHSRQPEHLRLGQYVGHLRPRRRGGSWLAESLVQFRNWFNAGHWNTLQPALPELVAGAGETMAVVATWPEFAYDAAELAAVAVLLWPGITALDRGLPAPPGTPCFSIAFLAATPPDGSPRLHPFCPVLAGGRLLAAIPRSSPKGNDLRREPRCAIHAVPGPQDDELSIRARAREAGNDPGLRAAALAVVTRSGVGAAARSRARTSLRPAGQVADAAEDDAARQDDEPSQEDKFVPSLGR